MNEIYVNPLHNDKRYRCKMCGEPRASRRRSTRIEMEGYICERCKRIEKRKEKIALSQNEVNRVALDLFDEAYKYDKQEEKFEKAIKKLEKQKKSINKYKNSIEKIHKYLHHPQWFQSTEEIMAAIVIDTLGIKMIHQQRVKNYKIDFVLPDKKAIVEIDGSTYHGNLQKEAERDFCIRRMLGFDWKIFHVDAEIIDKCIWKFEKLLKEL